MAHAGRTGIVLAVIGSVVVGFLAWSRSPAAERPVSVGGDPVLADMAFLPAGDVHAAGKYSFFILERENSSHRWFMRFDSEKGTLEKLTAERGWAPVASTRDMAN